MLGSHTKWEPHQEVTRKLVEPSYFYVLPHMWNEAGSYHESILSPLY